MYMPDNNRFTCVIVYIRSTSIVRKQNRPKSCHEPYISSYPFTIVNYGIKYVH